MTKMRERKAGANGAIRRTSHNLNGQRLGRKGRDTRDRIIGATREILGEGIETTLSLSEVARRSSIGMSSIYNYFADLTELVLAVLEPVMKDADSSFMRLLREPWPDEELAERCATFVGAFHDFWRRNSRVLHMRNSIADQPDVRMMAHRVGSAQPIIRALIRQMGRDPREAKTAAAGMATILYTGLERVVSVVTDPVLAAV
ncbi:MAG TPA: TetR/AcrR family transcriptional regulator, partial [Reyranella sp.]|nr:TetR/AcrR family transcriptional regulator [Reyranella sp.]